MIPPGLNLSTQDTPNASDQISLISNGNFQIGRRWPLQISSIGPLRYSFVSPMLQPIRLNLLQV